MCKAGALGQRYCFVRSPCSLFARGGPNVGAVPAYHMTGGCSQDVLEMQPVRRSRLQVDICWRPAQHGHHAAQGTSTLLPLQRTQNLPIRTRIPPGMTSLQDAQGRREVEGKAVQGRREGSAGKGTTALPAQAAYRHRVHCTAPLNRSRTQARPSKLAPAPHSSRSEDAYWAGVPGGVHELPVTQCLRGALPTLPQSQQKGSLLTKLLRPVASMSNSVAKAAPMPQGRRQAWGAAGGAAAGVQDSSPGAPLHDAASINSIAAQPIGHEVIVGVRGGRGVVRVALRGGKKAAAYEAPQKAGRHPRHHGRCQASPHAEKAVQAKLRWHEGLRLRKNAETSHSQGTWAGVAVHS